MRILNVNALLDAATGGGTAERTLQLSRALAAEGAEVTVLTLDIGLDPERRQRLGKAHVTALPCVNRRFMLPSPAHWNLDTLVETADVVQLTGHWTIINVLAARAARQAGKPYVICPAGALPIVGRSRLLKHAYNALAGRRIVAGAAGWVAITALEREQFVPYGVAPERVTIIPNGVWMEDFAGHDGTAFRERHALGTRPYILFVGRLNPIKGPDLLLDAFLRLGPRCRHHLVFAGPDEGLRAPLTETARAAGAAERVHFTGFVGGEEKASAYQGADLVVVPSRQEAMSIVALEAGACARPVVLTDRCGFDEVEAVAGGRVVSATADALARTLDELLATDPGGLRAMGERLAGLVASRYSWTAAARQYLALFTAVSATHP